MDLKMMVQPVCIGVASYGSRDGGQEKP